MIHDLAKRDQHTAVRAAVDWDLSAIGPKSGTFIVMVPGVPELDDDRQNLLISL